MPRFDVSAVLLDIEGTVAPLSFVHEVLFPYARAKLDSFLNARGSEPSVVAALELISQTTSASDNDLKPAILRLMDADSKTTGLKQLQGLIWDEGYRRGELTSPLFDDVLGALRILAKRRENNRDLLFRKHRRPAGLLFLHLRGGHDRTAQRLLRHDDRPKTRPRQLSQNRRRAQSSARSRSVPHRHSRGSQRRPRRRMRGRAAQPARKRSVDLSN